MPQRIQRKRTEGWTAPLDDARRRPVYVGRPTKWGNPWVATQDGSQWVVTWIGRGGWEIAPVQFSDRSSALSFTVGLYREWLRSNVELGRLARMGLVGRNLMCWCALDQPCHADVLLEVANGGAS